jgi:DNA gyrase subunit B
MLASEEVRALIIAMGTAIAEEFDIERLRYHKIVIMTDADVDGAHIRTLLLTLFYRYFPQLIDKGYLYIAQPPLFKISKGSKSFWAYNDADKDKIIKELAKAITPDAAQKSKKDKTKQVNEGDSEWEVESVDGTGANEFSDENNVEDDENISDEEKISGLSIQRYKGLGEMNPDQLWETTLNPENRVLLRVTMKDAQEADEVFDVLMGSEVLPRKKFIQTHAKSVKNLDI